RAALAEPVRDRIFFAGEATHETLWGTVGGAWASGERAADAAIRKLGLTAGPPEPKRPAASRRRRRDGGGKPFRPPPPRPSEHSPRRIVSDVEAAENRMRRARCRSGVRRRSSAGERRRPQ